MNHFRIANWAKFQHYKNQDAPPVWIKLYTKLLDDYDFEALPDSGKLHLLLIWLLAAKAANGPLPYDSAFIKRRLGVAGKVDLEVLKSRGFIELVYNDSRENLDSREIIDKSYSDSRAEKRREEESREEESIDTLFATLKESYPQRSGSQPWKKARIAVGARLKAGATQDASARGNEAIRSLLPTRGQGRNTVRHAGRHLLRPRGTLHAALGH